MIEIHNFPASYGDTFLVCIKENGFEEVNILIDCGKGFSANAQKMLKTMGEDKLRKIDRFIITHFDDDHIAGLYGFLQENGEANKPQIIEIEQIWLNTFRHMQFTKRNIEPLSCEEIKRLEMFKLSFPNINFEREEGEIGAKQALLAGRLIYEKGYKWNTDFGGQACTAFRSIQIAENVRMHILTPTLEKLMDIESDFIQELEKHFDLFPNDDDVFDDAYELYLKNEGKEKKKEGTISLNEIDISVEKIPIILKNTVYDPDVRAGNGSSISFILETSTKRMLFLADAHAEDIINSLRIIFPDQSLPLFFDAIKVAHHGSFRNNKPELFELIDSDKYIFSTNGKHPSHVHPDIATIAHIINRPLLEYKSKRTLYFNHPFEEKQEHLNAFIGEELCNQFNYEVSMNKKIIV